MFLASRGLISWFEGKNQNIGEFGSVRKFSKKNTSHDDKKNDRMDCAHDLYGYGKGKY